MPEPLRRFADPELEYEFFEEWFRRQMNFPKNIDCTFNGDFPFFTVSLGELKESGRTIPDALRKMYYTVEGHG